MKDRCSNPNNPRWQHYGGRGIAVCDRWLSFENFLADMPPHPGVGYSLERVDVNGNYEPGNCTWATSREQTLNRRPQHNAIYVDGLRLKDWAAKEGISYSCAHQRVAAMRKRGYKGVTQ